jgi:methylmalonyl-CoA mutase
LAQAFRQSGTTVACLCSSDEVYGEQAVAAIITLKTAGASRILLAGRPATLQEQLEQAGLDDVIAVGVNLLQILGPLQDHLQQSQVGGSA